MFFIHFICSLSFSLSKYVCFDNQDGKKCDEINEQYQNKFIKYQLNQFNDLFNESVETLYLAIFQTIGPINIPNDNSLNELLIISDFKDVELNTQKQSLTLKKLNIQNTTIKIATNSNEFNILDITEELVRSNTRFLPSNSNKIKLIMHNCDSFLLLRDFDEFEIDSYYFEKEKVSSFTFPSITNDCFLNSSIKITMSDTNHLPKDFTFVLNSGNEEESLIIYSKSYFFSKSSNFLNIHTSIPFTYIHNSTHALDIYIHRDYCDSYSPFLDSNFESKNGFVLKFYSGIARFHGGCNSEISLDRSAASTFLINSYFFNDSSIEFDLNSSSSSLPLSIISSNDLSMKLNHEFSSILGYLFIGDGNISIKGSQQYKKFHFSCSSFLNFSEKVYTEKNEQLFQYFDLTESEFYESIKHVELLGFLLLDENVVFSPTFLINAEKVVGGRTVAKLITAECAGVDFHPRTKLSLKENGTVVIPYHLNLNETYEGVMEIHRKRYAQLADKGENRTFDFDDFYGSFKYYYIKYMPVFSNFTGVFVKTRNQFYPPVIEDDQKSLNSDSKISIVPNHDMDLNHFVRLFIQRDDSPINSWYDTQYRSLLCNLTINDERNDHFEGENFEVELSASKVSEFAKVGEFKLNGEVKFNPSTSCIDYRVKEPPASSSELFVFLINNDLIDSVSRVPFVSVITPNSGTNFFGTMRNKRSKNVIIAICEDMTDQIDFTSLRPDSNIFVFGFSIKHMNEMIDFFNTIRKGGNLKSDLKKALDKISPKIPEILPTARIKVSKSQSLTAVGVTVDSSLIESGSVTLALCEFRGRTFIGSTSLITDLYSIQNLIEKVTSYKFVNVSIVPNFIGSRGGTTDLLSVTKIEFDENGWFFFSKGTVYDNARMDSPSLSSSRSFNFGVPYLIAEKDLFVFSVTDRIEFSLIQSKIPPKSLHFISGEKVNKKLLKEKVAILSESDELVEVPETTTLSFTGDWEANRGSVGQFSFEFGNSNAVIEKVPNSIDIEFSGGRNITIDCNHKDRRIKRLLGKGQIMVNSIDGYVSIESLVILPFERTFLDVKRQSEFLQITNIECEQYSRASLSDVSLKKITLNPDSSLEVSNLKFEEESMVQFNYNYDFEMPLLTIHNGRNEFGVSNLNSVVLNYSRRHHSQFDPSFESRLNKSRVFLRVLNSKCSLFDESLFSFESDFSDFNGQKYVRFECAEKEDCIEFSLRLFERPSLKLSGYEKVVDADQIMEDPLSPPGLYIPSPSRTKKLNDMSAAIIGGSVGGVAFAGILAFVVYFVVTGKREDEALLDSLERRNARGEGIDDSVVNPIGVSAERGMNESAENTTNESIETTEKKDVKEDSVDLNEEVGHAQFMDDFEKP